MRARLIVMYILCCSLIGCVKGGQVEFVSVCKDHVDLTIETNNALILSITAEMHEIMDVQPVDEDSVAALRDLVRRLRLINDQATVMNDYVNTTHVTEELIAEMIQRRTK